MSRKKGPSGEGLTNNPAGRKPIFTEADIPKIAEVIRENNGFKSRAARALGVSIPTLHNFVKAHPELQVVVDEQRQINVDDVHDNILNRIKNNEPRSDILAMFYLKTQGGWSETRKVIQENHNFDWRTKLAEAEQEHEDVIESFFIEDDSSYSGW